MYHDEPLVPSTLVRHEEKSTSSIIEMYKIYDIVDYLLSREKLLIKVALQFPDTMLKDSVAVIRQLEQAVHKDKRYSLLKQKASASLEEPSGPSMTCCSRVEKLQRTVNVGTALDNPNRPTIDTRFFVLCDSTFGSCCPDEITAQHYSAQCIIHFGEACMSRSSGIPVFYVHPVFHFELILEDTIYSALSPQLVSSVIEMVARQAKEAEQRHLDQETAPVKSLVELVIVGAYPCRPLIESTKAIFSVKAAEMIDSIVPVKWCWYENSEIITTNNPLNEESVETAGGKCIKSWVVNGVRFPMIAAQEAGDGVSADAIQLFLYVGGSTTPHPLHLSGVLQYNQSLYTDDQRELCEMLSEVVPFLSILDETSFNGESFQTLLKEWKGHSEGAHDASTAEKVQHVSNALLACSLEDICPSGYTTSYKAQLEYNRRTRQRDYNIEVLRGSSSVGILVVSLSIQGYYETTNLLHKLLRLHKKRAYIIYVGHLNEFKLSNFVDTVDCFVAVACPNSRESHFPLKSDGYMKPVVSPVEVIIALSEENDESVYKLPAAYSTALEFVIPPLENAVRKKTLALEQQKKIGHQSEESWKESAQLVRSSNALSSGTGSAGALDRLYSRSYVGLEPQIGETPIQEAITKGKHGIARGYQSEREKQ